ncbi:MAG: hypothetical protein SNJ66_10560, partial [Chloroherpetonaceae bacterium]
ILQLPKAPRSCALAQRFSASDTPEASFAKISIAKQGSIVMRKLEFDFEKIEVVGVLPTPDNRNPTVKTVWHIDKGTDFPRFITAIPHKK